MSKILITGATGQLGGMIVNELTGKTGSDNISVLARDVSKAGKLKEKGVNVIPGDYNDYDSLVTAFKGIEKLFFISGSDVSHRGKQHENIVRAAKECRIGHVIYTSFQRKSDDESSPIAYVASAHILAEKLLKESGLTYTLLKHALYAEFVPMFMGDQVLETGVIFLPAGDGKASFASRADMASAGVSVLTGKEHENKTYEISASKSYSFYDVAEILSELSGKPIKYTAPDVHTFASTLTLAGVSREGIQAISTFCVAISQGEFDFPDNTLEKLIGRQPITLKEILKKAYNLQAK